jgi:hypothetical protein
VGQLVVLPRTQQRTCRLAYVTRLLPLVVVVARCPAYNVPHMHSQMSDDSSSSSSSSSSSDGGDGARVSDENEDPAELLGSDDGDDDDGEGRPAKKKRQQGGAQRAKKAAAAARSKHDGSTRDGCGGCWQVLQRSVPLRCELLLTACLQGCSVSGVRAAAVCWLTVNPCAAPACGRSHSTGTQPASSAVSCKAPGLLGMWGGGKRPLATAAGAAAASTSHTGASAGVVAGFKSPLNKGGVVSPGGAGSVSTGKTAGTEGGSSRQLGGGGALRSLLHRGGGGGGAGMLSGMIAGGYRVSGLRRPAPKK